MMGILMNFLACRSLIGVSGKIPLGPSTTGPNGPARDPCCHTVANIINDTYVVVNNTTITALDIDSLGSLWFTFRNAKLFTGQSV